METHCMNYRWNTQWGLLVVFCVAKIHRKIGLMYDWMRNC